MELSLRTSRTSYVVCDVKVRGYCTGTSNEVMVKIIPRDGADGIDRADITLDLSIGDSLDLIAAITSELRKEKE